MLSSMLGDEIEIVGVVDDIEVYRRNRRLAVGYCVVSRKMCLIVAEMG